MENIAMDPVKPFPWSVISVIGPAAMEMFCRRTGVTGNNIRAISKKYNSAHIACKKCRFVKACDGYKVYTH
jgi:hypothetical protein